MIADVVLTVVVYILWRLGVIEVSRPTSWPTFKWLEDSIEDL